MKLLASIRPAEEFGNDEIHPSDEGLKEPIGFDLMKSDSPPTRRSIKRRRRPIHRQDQRKKKNP